METLIQGVTILPGEGSFIPQGFIHLRGDRIAGIGAGDGPVPGSRGGLEIRNGAGLVALPGLINAHTHVSLSRYRGIADNVRLFDFLRETRKRWSRATFEDTFQ